MTRFPTPAHLASWARFAPGISESAGRKKGNSGTGHGNRYLARALGEAAVGASRTNTFLGERYRRIARRRGKKRAIVAVGRSILIIIWHLLSDDRSALRRPRTRLLRLPRQPQPQHPQPRPRTPSPRLQSHPRTRRLTTAATPQPDDHSRRAEQTRHRPPGSPAVVTFIFGLGAERRDEFGGGLLGGLGGGSRRGARARRRGRGSGVLRSIRRVVRRARRRRGGSGGCGRGRSRRRRCVGGFAVESFLGVVRPDLAPDLAREDREREQDRGEPDRTIRLPEQRGHTGTPQVGLDDDDARLPVIPWPRDAS